VWIHPLVTGNETCYVEAAGSLRTCAEENLPPVVSEGSEGDNPEDVCEDEMKNVTNCPVPDAADLKVDVPPALWCVAQYYEWLQCVALGCPIQISVCTDAAGGDILLYDDNCEDYQRRGCAREICTRINDNCLPCYPKMENYTSCAEGNVVRCDPPTIETCDLPDDSAGFVALTAEALVALATATASVLLYAL